MTLRSGQGSNMNTIKVRLNRFRVLNAAKKRSARFMVLLDRATERRYSATRLRVAMLCSEYALSIVTSRSAWRDILGGGIPFHPDFRLRASATIQRQARHIMFGTCYSFGVLTSE